MLGAYSFGFSLHSALKSVLLTAQISGCFRKNKVLPKSRQFLRNTALSFAMLVYAKMVVINKKIANGL